MKKTYLAPDMTVVRLQHHGIICLSDIDSNADLGFGGASTNNSGGSFARTREYTSVWDQEW